MSCLYDFIRMYSWTLRWFYRANNSGLAAEFRADPNMVTVTCSSAEFFNPSRSPRRLLTHLLVLTSSPMSCKVQSVDAILKALIGWPSEQAARTPDQDALIAWHEDSGQAFRRTSDVGPVSLFRSTLTNIGIEDSTICQRRAIQMDDLRT